MHDTFGKFRKTALLAADGAAILVAASLPWSTSATSVLVVVWLLTFLPTLHVSALAQECATSYGGTPVLLFGFGLVSLGWADTGLKEGLSALVPFVRLLAIPLLIVQFRNSSNAHFVVGAYLAACVLLLAATLVSSIFPVVVPSLGMKHPGLPVKDRIVQDGEFALCGFGLLLWAGTTWTTQRYKHVFITLPLAVLFFVAILYVEIVRTELIIFAVLFALLFSRWFGWKGIPVGLAVAASIFALAWVSSPNLRSRVTNVGWELQEYYQHNGATSAGDRLEWWRKSLEFVRADPLIGHGVGATKSLFTASTIGESGVSALATANPHNQIFAIAIELGLIGVAALLAMWAAHVRLFQGVAGLPWLGMIVVVQNIVGSLFNSHLFDFTQGWTYVFGVGVFGGMALSPAKNQFTTTTDPVRLWWSRFARRGGRQGVASDRWYACPMSSEPNVP